MALSNSAVVSAIRGAFLADAACMGTHWIYNPNEMAKTVPSLEKPEFRDPPSAPFYSADEYKGHYGAGMLSPYGEQMLFVTEHVASTGSVDGMDMSKKMFDWIESGYTGRQDAAMKRFVENMKAGKKFPECGADDHEAHCYMKSVPVTCMYAGKPEMKEKVEAAIRVHQNNDQAVAFGVASACILERALLGDGLPDDEFIENCTGISQEVKDAWKKASTFDDLETLMLELSHEIMKGKEDSPRYDVAGRSCALPGAFIAPAFLIQQASANEGEFAKALRSNILGSGDTCSRGVFLGAVLAAAAGKVPEDWLSNIDQDTMAKIDTAAKKIAAMATTK